MIISICNSKGGVGKTTTCYALATAKGITGKKVLMVDLDGQHSLSSSCDVDLDNVLDTLCDFFISELNDVRYDMMSVRDSIIHLKNVDILPCNNALYKINTFLTKQDNFTALKNILYKVAFLYDYVFIDCPPNYDALTKNAIIASDKIIIPVESDFMGSENLYQLMCTIENINHVYNTQVSIEGIIFTMYQNNKVCNSVVEYVKNLIKRKNSGIKALDSSQKRIKVFADTIPRSIRVGESEINGQSIVEYSPDNPVAKAYINIASKI